MTARQDVTFFGDDDVTPLVGAVDATGAITVASFSTDPSHPRPWLDEGMEGVSQEINLIEGTASIGQFRISILDSRTVATDQRTGYFTNLLSSQQGYSALTMRRVVYRIEGPDGKMHVAQNGVVTNVSLNSDSVSYDIAIRDMSERARKTRIFNKLTGSTPRYGATNNGVTVPSKIAGFTIIGGLGNPFAPFYTGDPIPGELPKYGSCLFPPGPLNGYGRMGSLPGDPTLAAALGGSFLIKPLRAAPVRCVFTRDPTYPSYRGVFTVGRQPAGTPSAQWDYIMPNEAAIAAGWPSTGIDPFSGNPLAYLIYQDSIIFWRKVGSTNWHRVENMPFRTGDLSPSTNTNPNGITTGSPFPKNMWLVPSGDPRGSGQTGLKLQMTFLTANHQDLPQDQAQCDILVMDAGAPTADKPIYVSSTWGDLLKDIYDGLYSVGYNGGPTPIFGTGSGYDPALFAQFSKSTPYLEFRKFAAEPDALAWLPDNMYKPFGAVPAIDENGLVAPFFYALPDASAVLAQIDDTNTVYENSSWELTSDGAVNEVLVTYTREYILDGVVKSTQEVDLQFLDPTAESIGGEKEVTYAPETLTSVVGLTTSNIGGTGDTTQDLGTKLAAQRWNEVNSRFRYGNQNLILTCDRSSPAIESLKVGAWCLVVVSWLPDFGTGLRGTNRLMQVMSRKNLDAAFTELKLSDAGPAGQPALQPTIGAITVNAMNEIDVEIQALQDGTKAVVQYNLGSGANVASVFGYTVGDAVPGTFARAASAYQTNSDGSLTYSGANVARDAHYISGTRVLLLEPQRTNLLLQTKDVSNAAWIKAGVGGPATPTVTGAQYTSPDGVASSAAKIAIPAVSGGTGVGSYARQLAAGQPSAAQTFSAYLRGNAGGETTYVISGSSGGVYTSTLATLTTAWSRWTVGTGTAATYSGFIGVNLTDASEVAQAAATIGAWGMQLETGYATSYIPTTGSTATRDADVLTVSVPGGAAQAGTLYEKYIDLSTGTLVEQVNAYTTSSTYVPATGRGWISWKFALGTQSLAQMQAASSSGGSGGASTVPAQSDGGWLFMGSVNVPGYVESQSMPSGSTVWVRSRAENGQRVGSATATSVPIRASAWTTPVPVAIPNIPVVTALKVTVTRGTALTHIRVETSNGTGGIRAYYGQKVYDGSEPNMPSYVEFQVVGGVLDVDLPMVAQFGKTQYVDVFPSTGWDSVNGVTSGAYGLRARGVLSYEDATTAVLPTAYGVMDETATLGTLSVYVNDPQGRTMKVEANSQTGSGAWSGWAAMLGTTSPYRASVDLVGKQPSKIGFRVWGADLNNNVTVLAEDTFTFSLSGLPTPVTLREFVDVGGNFQISWLGDFNTNYVKVAASIVGFPTPDVVRAAAKQPGPTGLTSALPVDIGGATEAVVQSGQTIYVAAFGYTADDLEGQLALYKVTYLGIGSTPLPDVIIGTPIAEATRVRFPFSWDSQTTDIIAWYKVYTAGSAPSAAFNVIRAAGATALPPISVSEGLMEISVPLANATDVAFLTLTGRDPLNQRGPIANARQAGNGSATFPAAPTAASNTGNTSSLTTNSVTTPSTALTTWKIRTYRNGVVYGSDTAVAVAGAHAQTLTYAAATGDAYSYTYTMIDATGAESATTTTAFTVTVPAPSAPSAPTINAVLYDTSSSLISISVTPAGGTPGNIVYHVETGLSSGGSFVEDTTAQKSSVSGTASVTLSTYRAQAATSVTRWIRVWVTASGVAGTRSAAASVFIPAAPTGGGGGHTAQ